jgi:hypothetical protein
VKNPTASAGFEAANLGTKGQHLTSRPPKPLSVRLIKILIKEMLFGWTIVHESGRKK